jgi:hypothetical protein
MKKVWIINENNIEQVNHQELCDEYAKETTTPHGVGRVDFVEEVTQYTINNETFESLEEAEDMARYVREDGEDDTITEKNVWVAYKWLSSNPHRLNEEFDTEDEAKKYLDACAVFDFENDAEAPLVFDTKEEAQAFIDELDDE